MIFEENIGIFPTKNRTFNRFSVNLDVCMIEQFRRTEIQTHSRTDRKSERLMILVFSFLEIKIRKPHLEGAEKSAFLANYLTRSSAAVW